VLVLFVSTACDDHAGRAERVPATSTRPPAASSTTLPTTLPTSTDPTALPAGGPLVLSGSTGVPAEIDVRVDDVALPGITTTEPGHEFDLTVPGVSDGTHTILVDARAASGGPAALQLQAALTVGGSSTRSSVTCEGPVELRVRIEGGTSLNLNCPPG
jgi:hypothetical protein